MNHLSSETEGFWLRIIYIVSVLVTAAVAFLILGPRPHGVESALDVSVLPRVNATLNGVTTVLLVVAFVFIRQRRIEWHRNTMLLAFGTSMLFLISYVIYHWFKAGPKAYEGEFSEVYFFILISHILLAVVNLPLVLRVLWLAHKERWDSHRKLARITWPIWMYVSVTGVLVYLLLYPLNPEIA